MTIKLDEKLLKSDFEISDYTPKYDLYLRSTFHKFYDFNKLL